MFIDRGSSGDGKWRWIEDDASTMSLQIDTDDVNPDDVSEERIGRMVRALNREFYPAPPVSDLARRSRERLA